MADTPALTERQQRAIAQAAATKNALLEAQQHLQHALGLPQTGREQRWADRVARELEAARKALDAHKMEVRGPGGLYEELRFDAPWLIPRVDQLVAQMDRVERELADLATEIRHVQDGDLRGLHHIRHDAERALAMLRDLLAREGDLVYERFNEPAALD
ncbi:hypothetical protein HRbin29_02265 [bacterium HR29]|nr:hypothetical protein HRbin29_02265 [bacterium HR29]